jgi:hypothetical protein
MTAFPFVIELSMTEVQIAGEIARSRGAFYKHLDSYYGSAKEAIKTGPEEKNRRLALTFAAELAVCKYLNTYPQLDVAINQHDLAVAGDVFGTVGQHDLVYHGWTIDVKQTTLAQGRLLGKLSHKPLEFRSDIFVLVHSEQPKRQTILGWAWSNDLYKDGNREYFTKDQVPTYQIKQEDLDDISALRIIGPKDWRTNGT